MNCGRISAYLVVAATLLSALCMPLGAVAQQTGSGTTVTQTTAASQAADKSRQKTRGKKNKPKSSAPAPVVHHDYTVQGGILHDAGMAASDSLHIAARSRADSLRADSLSRLPNREQRRAQRALDDSIHGRYSRFFRDTMPISRMCAISLVVPGFSQFHNQQYWKIPIAWATLAGTIYGFAKENKPYQNYKSQYEDLVAHQAPRSQIDPVQTKMIQANTYRQILMAGIYASWVYFISDGAVNYPGTTSSVKKATTLSTILPGAGQFYNKSYWKIPFVVGGFATMAYLIDWNNRGYMRYKLDYQYATDNDPSTIDEYDGRVPADQLLNMRNNFRRNRDLCIILTGAFYLLNIIDAHADAHMKTYDISDDISMNIEPTMINLYSMSRPAARNLPGFTLSIRF